jgi:hypothetical protein
MQRDTPGTRWVENPETHAYYLSPAQRKRTQQRSYTGEPVVLVAKNVAAVLICWCASTLPHDIFARPLRCPCRSAHTSGSPHYDAVCILLLLVLPAAAAILLCRPWLQPGHRSSSSSSRTCCSCHPPATCCSHKAARQEATSDPC